jgi:hypothetical protein
MPNYKVVVHRDKFGTKAVYTERQVDSRKLSEIIYGLTCEYPGCSISLYPEKTYIITKSQSIQHQLEKFLGNAPTTQQC